MAITENTVQIGSLTWFYREALPDNDLGKPPVLLLHGLPSHSYTWVETINTLASSGLRAIAPDWIGSGASAKPDKQDFAYTPEAFLQALSDLIAALELKELSLVVQGFLASVGLQYAIRYPETINRLIILNTPLSTKAKLPQSMKQWGWPFIGDMLTQDPLLVDRTLEQGSGYVISDENLAIYRQPFLKTSAVGRALVATIQNLQLTTVLLEIESGLKTFPQPILVIWGSRDPWLPFPEGENWEIAELPEAKHYPQEHWLAEIAPLMINFLQESVPLKAPTL